jgi:hypothetical protein
MKLCKLYLLVIFCFLLSGCKPANLHYSSITPLKLKVIFTSTPSITFSLTPANTSINTLSITNTKTIAITNTSTVTLTRNPNERFYETKDIIPFSYIPPKDWNQHTDKKYNTTWEFGLGLRPDTTGCELGFGVLDEPNTTPYEFSIEYRNGKVLESGPFYINAGYKAYKLSVRMGATSGDAEVTYYFITNGEYFIIAGFDRLYSTFVNQDIIVDNSIKTIKFEIK